MANGDLPAARREMEADLAGHSLTKRAWVSSTASTTTAKLPPNVLGDHMPGTGDVRITAGAARDGRAFAKAWRKDPAKVRAAVAEYQKHRDDFLAGRRSDPPDPKSDGARLFRQASRYEVLVHEVLHGYGRVPSLGFKNPFRLRIEEITTEAAARKFMSDRFGVVIRGAPGRGQEFSYGYELWLHQTARGIATASGVDFDRAWTAMLEASEDFKRSAVTDSDTEQTFADLVHQRLGGRTTATRQQIQDAVRASWSAPMP